MLSDVIDVDVLLELPRHAIWEYLSDPEWYPRFFRGMGTCERLTEAEPDRPAVYAVRVAPPHAEAVNLGLRAVIGRNGSDFTLESVDGSSFVSVRLFEVNENMTRIVATFFKAAQIHPALMKNENAALTAWTREGLQRIEDFLTGKPTSIVSNSGDYRSVQLSVAKTMVKTGVVRAARPDRGIKQLNSLAKWGFTLAGGFAAAAAREPKTIALADRRGSLTFAELHERTNRLAAALPGVGVTPGSTVAIMARNHAAMVECMVACGKLGAHLLLLNTGLGARQVEELLVRHNPQVVFLDDEFDSVIQYLRPNVMRISTAPAPNDRPTLEGLILGAPSTVVKATEPGRLIVLTSGTNGSPKSAKRPTPKGFQAVAAMLSRMPLQMGEKMLIAAPLFHSWGLAALQISTPIRSTVVLADRFDAEDCLRAISVHRCTSLIAVPVMIQRILDLPPAVRARYDTSSLRVVACSGSPMSGQLVTSFMDTFGDILYNFYGSTEVSWGTIADPTDLRAAPTTAGRPPLGTRISVLDEHGSPLPCGAVGRIFVGNDMLFDGYTDAAPPPIAGQLMDTGDLGYIDADGRLFVSGRDDEMIISGGENVFPRPVEEALAHLPQVSEVAVVGVPDVEYGQRLVAFVVPREGARLDQDMVRSYIHHRLSRFSVPRDVTFLTALPRNATGKILKRVLIQPTA
ncbi:AMP-binding protein [Antrihabitans sp. YC2-6]|uniref:AMP-binding protein n=1 Tax=Antrihabitans sp. YC2-6 TaxID=2799498 RepID=UPI0018F616CF|nr:AMP-binding protein [Antrihabitans sp. YC2-6]MBJ8346258.1 AMP-binding protein [Antrihabitans sp. YC2-6]